MNTSATDISVSVLNFKLWAAGRRITLAGTYVSRTQAREMREALAFWEVVHSCRKAPGTLCVPVLLHTFSTHHNPYLALVARLESLPTRVLRRVLWFYNIDFQSRESCLRRITSTQRDGVYETYAALYGNTPHIPTCFCSGVWDGLRQHLPGVRVTFSELLNGTFEGTERYRQKNAIAHDFGGLGWGFTLYKSTDIDDQVPESVTQQFLSPKNHHNDFTVNHEEGGVYWPLYSFVRSNYLWNRTGTVTLHRAICPGMYLTLFALIAMVLCAPLLLPIAGLVWCCEQICTGCVALADMVEKRFPGLPKIVFDKGYWENVFTCVGVVVVGAIGSVVCAVVWRGFTIITGGLMWVSVGYTVCTLLYVLYMEYMKRWMLPTSVPYGGKFVSFLFLVHMSVEYRAFLRDVFQAMGVWIHTHYLELLFGAGVVVYVVVVIWVCKRMYEWYDTTPTLAQQERAEKFYVRGMCIAWLVGGAWVVAASVLLVRADFPFKQVLGVGGTLVPMFILMEALLTRYQPKRVYNRAYMTVYSKEWKSSTYDAFFKTVAPHNVWLQTLDTTTLPLMLEKIAAFVDKYCYEDEHVSLFRWIDARGVTHLDAYRAYFRVHKNHREYFLSSLVRGIPLDEAKRSHIDLMLKKQQKEAFYDSVAHCIDACITPFSDAWDRTVDFVEDINELRKGLDKRCPWVAPQEKEIA